MKQKDHRINSATRTNILIFAILMLLTQIAVCLLYGFYCTINPSLINVTSIFIAIALAILTVAGFGLVFSYLKRLVWSGIGFTFLITAFCIQIYPLVNAFWTKTRIQNNTTVNDFTNKNFNLLLANPNIANGQLYGNCITNAFKCALAVSAAFSSILGRVGPLQCFIVSGVGVIGFQLNRQIILNLAIDSFGSYFIFTFGGFMGLALGLLLKQRQQKQGASTAQNQFNNGCSFTASYALLGAIIIFVLMPVLAYDIDSFNPYKIYHLYNGPLSVIIGMAASLLGAYCISSLLNGNVIVRDLIHAPIAGGIVVGSASFYITNPVYAMVAGFTAGIIQTLIQNLIQLKYAQTKGVVSTISWSLFGGMGLISGVFATGYKTIIVNGSTSDFNYDNTGNFNPGYELLIATISAGIGLGFGVISGLLLMLVSPHFGYQQFIDRTYWINDDGISFPKPKPIKKPAEPNVQKTAPPEPKKQKIQNKALIKEPAEPNVQKTAPPEPKKQNTALPAPQLPTTNQLQPQPQYSLVQISEMSFEQAKSIRNIHAYL